MYLIKFCKTKTFLSAVSLVMVLAMLNMGLGFHALAGSRSAKAYTGEEIFGGIFFGQGEVAKLLPEIWEQHQAALKTNGQEFEKIRNEVISEIKTNKPDFFKEFGVEMRSGDHLRVWNSLNSGYEMLQNIIGDDGDKATYSGTCIILPLTPPVPKPTIYNPPKPFFVSPTSMTEASALYVEELVDMVANRLHKIT